MHIISKNSGIYLIGHKIIQWRHLYNDDIYSVQKLIKQLTKNPLQFPYNDIGNQPWDSWILNTHDSPGQVPIMTELHDGAGQNITAPGIILLVAFNQQ